MKNQPPDVPGDANAARFDDATVKHSDQVVPAGEKRGATHIDTEPAEKSAEETSQIQAAPTEDSQLLPTGMFDPATAHTMDLRQPVDESVVYEVRPLKKALPKSIGVYDIRRELGRGGMGVVYLARHRVLERNVALKMVLDATHADTDQLVRFTTEARAVAHLQHPNIVQIFEVGEHEGLPFFSLEYVNGPSLKERQEGKPLPPEEAAQIVEKLARAMQYAHDHQILHRDLKPANVLMTGAGVPKISDFGLAKRLSDTGDSASTRTGTVMGTPSYMSPEQARGDIKQLTSATDQYSLGAVLYELLTGRPPFMAPRPVDTILQVLREEPIPPRRTQPTLPIDLETICLKALQKEPFKRYADCTAFADDLRRFLVGEPIRARPVGNLERVRRWCKRNPKLATLSFTSAASLFAVVVILLVSTVTLSRKNIVIAQQNTDLIAAKELAEGQRKIAENERGIAVEKRQVAIDQASLALETIQTLIDKVMTQIGDTPNTQTLKKDLLETAVRGAERVTEHNQQTSREATILSARQKLGELYLRLGEVDKAFVEYEFVYQQAQERAKTQGGTDASRFNARSTSALMSDMYLTIKRDLAASRRLLKEAIAGYQEILDHPLPGYGAMPPYKVRLGMQTASNKLAVHFLRSGDPAKALVEFRRSHELLMQVSQSIDDERQLAALEPKAREKELETRPQVKSTLPNLEATAVLAIGGMLHRLRQPEEAEPHYRQAVAIRERLYEPMPNDPLTKFQLARTMGVLGEFLFQTGKTDAVEPLYQRSVVLAKELADADEKMIDYRRDQAIGHYRLGQLYQRQQKLEKAREQFQICCQLRESLVDPKAPNVKRQMEWMLALAHCGKHVEATELAEQIRQGNKPDNELLLDVARCYAQSSAAARNDPELAQRYTRKGLEALTAARDAGYNDTFNLEVDADLEPFRDNAEFQKLVSAKPAFAQ